MNDKLQGIHFDVDYSIETVVNMYKTKPIFEVIIVFFSTIQKSFLKKETI